MINETSIKYLSCLLDSPETITDGDERSLSVFRQTFPYFVPVRYIEAVESNKKAAFAPEMLAGLYPYVGNWIMFCDFLDASKREPVQLPPEEMAASSEQFFQLIRGEVAEAEEEPVSTEVELRLAATTAEAETENESVTEEQHLPPIVFQMAAPSRSEVAPQETENEAGIENEITEQASSTQEVEEPVVAVSDSFLQLIRGEQGPEEGNGHKEPVATVPAHNEPIYNEPSFDAPVAEAPVAEEKIHVPPIVFAPQPVFESRDEIERIVEAVQTEPVAFVHKETVAEEVEEIAAPAADEPQLIFPIYTQDYFLQQGEKISEEIPGEISGLVSNVEDDEDKSLMVMMSFTEWLLHFKNTTQKQEEEKKGQKALKTMWQKEKLAAAMEEENEEIPENVFEMAVNSITREDGLASESLADIYIKQGKYDKAIEMYRKLSLRNPQKNAYFARKIEEVLKEKQS